MKIAKIDVYSVNLDVWGGESRYASEGVLDAALDTTVLRLESDEGYVGWGETCTPPPYYLPTMATSARAGIDHLAPLFLGADPRDGNRIRAAAKASLRGHSPAHSAYDMALCDLAGKIAGLPLARMWGGTMGHPMPVLAMVSFGDTDKTIAGIESYRAQGYHLFQIKIGTGTVADDIDKIRGCMAALLPGERCWFDCNRAWSVDRAMQVIAGVKDLNPLIEQPCETYRECLTVARRAGIGLMLDELIDGPDALIRASEDGIIDVAVLKLGCTGGPTDQLFLSRLGAHLNIPMRIEDFYGTGITFAAVAAIAATLPLKTIFGLYDYHLPAVPVVKNPLIVENGAVILPSDLAPGLGIEVNTEVLGEPVASHSL